MLDTLCQRMEYQQIRTKVGKVKNWPRPTSPENVRQFVAFAGFYRRFIKDFSKVIKPLSEVMPPQNQKKGRNTTQTDDWKWGDSQEQAFNKLKDLMTSAPILAFAEYSLPFELHVDASGQALGAVLCQKQEGKARVVSYGSRTLNKAEKNYPTMKLEFLALKWAVTEKFNDYLYGNKFTVLTDNNPLTYVLTTAKLDATGHRVDVCVRGLRFEHKIYTRQEKCRCGFYVEIPTAA